MNTLLSHTLIAVTALAAAMLASCAHKDIECSSVTREIEVLFEWDKAPQAHVKGMTLYFYPMDSYSKIWRFDIAGRDGGRVELSPGHYRMIACNNDLPGIWLEDTGKFSGLTATGASRIDTTTVATTGMLYGVTVREIGVTPCGVRYTTADGNIKECVKGLVRCQPDSLSTQFTVRLTHPVGAGRIRTAYARLAPIASAMVLDSATPVGENAALYLALLSDDGNNMLGGRGCAFSSGTPANSPSHLWVHVTKADGMMVSRAVELADNNRNILSPHNVIITIDSLDLSDGNNPSPDDVGGIEAAVDGWTAVEIDVEASTR